ncbi:MAG: DUF1499 domain-containing protein [Mariprofundaceae bacterium]
MKLIISAAMMAGLIVLAFVALGMWSHSKPPDLGIVEGKLQPCPDKPNCVCSELYPDRQQMHTIAPIVVSGEEMGKAWKLLRDAIEMSGGIVISETDSYLHAEFVSQLFRFVDDVEIRLDRDNRKIHLRSASRVGHSDLGANRKRIETIWNNFGSHH